MCRVSYVLYGSHQMMSLNIDIKRNSYRKFFWRTIPFFHQLLDFRRICSVVCPGKILHSNSTGILVLRKIAACKDEVVNILQIKEILSIPLPSHRLEAIQYNSKPLVHFFFG